MSYKYACEFTVKGIGGVPIDMMRYDRATPLTQEDAAKAVDGANMMFEHNEIDAHLPPTQTIRMIRFTEGNGRNHADSPTVARWASFGWRILDITWRKLS